MTWVRKCSHPPTRYDGHYILWGTQMKTSWGGKSPSTSKSSHKRRRTPVCRVRPRPVGAGGRARAAPLGGRSPDIPLSRASSKSSLNNATQPPNSRFSGCCRVRSYIGHTPPFVELTARPQRQWLDRPTVMSIVVRRSPRLNSLPTGRTGMTAGLLRTSAALTRRHQGVKR